MTNKCMAESATATSFISPCSNPNDGNGGVIFRRSTMAEIVAGSGTQRPYRSVSSPRQNQEVQAGPVLVAHERGVADEAAFELHRRLHLEELDREQAAERQQELRAAATVANLDLRERVNLLNASTAAINSSISFFAWSSLSFRHSWRSCSPNLSGVYPMHYVE